MRILHTSDWHLGATLFGKRRHDEHRAFLAWLIHTVRAHGVNALLVAGDVFDSTTPPHAAQELYYSFLKDILATGCRHVVITAGNHDSPTLLEAAKPLLRPLNVHVVGACRDNPEEEIITLYDAGGRAEAIVCAVPYLREKDIRSTAPGESSFIKEASLQQAIRDHYSTVYSLAVNRQQQFPVHPPVVVMGHLFAAGSDWEEEEQARNFYLGALAKVPATFFPATIDYLALGHIHRPQMIGGSPTRRYCGSPLPMSFAETARKKEVVVADLATNDTRVHSLSIPLFQPLARLQGDSSQLRAGLTELRQTKQSVWVEILYTGKRIGEDLKELLERETNDSQIEILRIVNRRLQEKALSQETLDESLEQLSTEEVFKRCLADHGISQEQAAELLPRFHMAVRSLLEQESPPGELQS